VRSVSMTEASSLDPHRCERPMRVSQNASTLRAMQPTARSVTLQRGVKGHVRTLAANRTLQVTVLL
jgi:hypothetical protein